MSLLTLPSYSCMPAMVATALICISEVGHRRETFSRLLPTVTRAVHISRSLSLSLMHFNPARSICLCFGTCSILFSVVTFIFRDSTPLISTSTHSMFIYPW